MNPRIAELLQQLSLEEKAALCTGATPWQTVAVERLGLAPITVADGPHGVRLSKDLTALISESHAATCFPVAVALAASWDRELLYEMGQALGVEAAALGVDVLLGPGMNMKRSPLCGRNFEYFSEDPFVSGEMAAALVQGIQSKGVGTSVKHFAVNNQETRRFTVNVSVDERTLHEIYLAGFEIAIQKGKPWTVMCAYNSVNGDFCAQNSYLLTDVLRERWGYEGFVVSDWGAVHDRVASLEAGLELEMPGPSPHRTQAIIDAVNHGSLAPAILDRAVERLLNIILRAQETPKGHMSFPIEAHHSLARRVAAESMVLLKNEGGLLPLSGEERLAVIGQAAQTPVFQGGGSSHIHPTQVDNPLTFLKQRAEIQIEVGDGVNARVDSVQIDAAVAVASGADVALLFMALPASVESEGYDRPHMRLTEQQEALIQAVARVNPRTVVVLNNGAALDMRAWIDDVAAVIEAWLPGQAGAGAVVDVLYGDVNPSGKLTETFPLKLSDTPAYVNFPGERDEVRYGEGIFVGYRGYETTERDVLFPFGYGMSYTTFEYSNLRVSADAFQLGEPLVVTVDVSNTGTRAGKEVVQLYVRDLEAGLPRPPQELKGFTKVSLAPNETKTVSFILEARAFSYYHTAYHEWIAEPGVFEIRVGASSEDIRLTEMVTLTEGSKLPSIINMASTLDDWMRDPHGAALAKPLLQTLFGFGQGDALGVDMMTFFRDLPLTVLLGFRGAEADRSPHEIVAEMIAKLEAQS